MSDTKLYPPIISETLPAFYSQTKTLQNLIDFYKNDQQYQTNYTTKAKDIFKNKKIAECKKYLDSLEVYESKEGKKSFFTEDMKKIIYNNFSLNDFQIETDNQTISYLSTNNIINNNYIKVLNEKIINQIEKLVVYFVRGENNSGLTWLNDDDNKEKFNSFNVQTASKLYQIKNKIISILEKNEVTINPITITVPYTMNKTVNKEDVIGFSLKIKTVQDNVIIDTLKYYKEDEEFPENKVIFKWDDADEDIDDIDENINNKDVNGIFPSASIKVGQFLKVQMAYISKEKNEKDENVIGYYSNVGIIKHTLKPEIKIEPYQVDSEDKDFNEYDENQNLNPFNYQYTGIYEQSDTTENLYSYKFCLYDSNLNEIDSTGWLYNANTTFNGLDDNVLKTFCNYDINIPINSSEIYYIQFFVKSINNIEESSPLYALTELDMDFPDVSIKLKAENIFEEGYINLIVLNLSKNSKEIEISRAESTDDFCSWIPLVSIKLSSKEEWEYKDFNIEQGITYLYSIREYKSQTINNGESNEENLKYYYSSRLSSNRVVADFEDIFLWDGKKQLKIRFNPKVSSFKTNHLEQKMDTIGSKYPFIFRNAQVEYKEFPISGLISYQLDNNKMFINMDELLNENYNQYGLPTPLDTFIADYNVVAERKFKLFLLDWLGDGQIKMFKSPTEGNYLIRLLNVSLTPEDRLERMLHSFSCTAYEVEELNYKNLISLNFLEKIEHKPVTFEIDNDKISNQTETSFGSYNNDGELNNEITIYFTDTKIYSKPFIKFYFLNFVKKPVKDIKKISGSFYDENDQYMISFNKNVVYRVKEEDGETKYYFSNKNQNELIEDNYNVCAAAGVVGQEEDFNFNLTNRNFVSIKNFPSLYTKITFGNGLYAEYSYLDYDDQLSINQGDNGGE